MRAIRGDLDRLNDAQVIVADLADRHRSPNLTDAQRAKLRTVHVVLADMAAASTPGMRLVSS
jgi:hypothetical protein